MTPATLGMIEQTYATLFPPETVAEIRILNTPRDGTVSGYFNSRESFVKAAAAWSGKAPAVYATLNPCTPALLARSANRLKTRVKATTADHDIVRRVWLPLDFDPVRPADISSTDAEHETALGRAMACRDWLTARGWARPVSADSGNGGHLLYAVNLPNDDTSKALLKTCLEVLALYFTDSVVSLDVGVFNAARIWKVYGTMACKGDHLPERPHRLAQLLDVPSSVACVTHEQLGTLAAILPAPPKTAPKSGGSHTTFDLRQWIAAHGVPVVEEGPWQQSGYRWRLNPCPWNSAHTNKSAFLVQLVNGAIAAGCHHNGCQGNDWRALRDLYEPGWQSRRGAVNGKTADATMATDLRQHRNGSTPAGILPADASKRRNGSIPTFSPPPPEPLMPPLPPAAIFADEARQGAATLLETYVAHSETWAPRAMRHAHVACGLWLLSTINAGRDCVYMGKTVMPTLFLAQIADSTLWTKTTVADVATAALKQLGLASLLAPGQSTPQALMRDLSTPRVPDNYEKLEGEAQAAAHLAMAFHAQRGWFYEEWGGGLTQMMRQDSPMAALHRLIRILDDGKSDLSENTIARGLELADTATLALLALATPRDMVRFMQPGSNFWHDGFWPRFAFVVPMPDEQPSLKRRPLGKPSMPPAMVRALREWHQELGIPTVRVDKDGSGWDVTCDPHPQRELPLGAGVEEAYYTYNEALISLIYSGEAPLDLRPSYGRLHEKALRIAILLASVEAPARPRIALNHWAYAQHLTEQWRAMLHVLISTAGDATQSTREELLEGRLERHLRLHGPTTARVLRHNIRGYSSRELELTLGSMSKLGTIVTTDTGRTSLYSLYTEEGTETESECEK